MSGALFLHLRRLFRRGSFVSFIHTTTQDVRYGARMLRKNPLFTAVAVATLALGIGANTAIFGLFDAVVLRSLPVERPEELVQIRRHSPRWDNRGLPSLTNPIWEQIRDQQKIFSGAFAWAPARFDLARAGEAHYVKGLWVSGDFFRTLGVQPVLGRLIQRADDQCGCAGAAVLSYSFWQNHLGGVESVLGRTISLDSHSYPIIGVTPPGFHGLEVGTTFDVVLPVCATESLYGTRTMLEHRSWWWLNVMGRVNPQIGPDHIKAHLDLLAPRIFAATVPSNWAPAGQKDYLSCSLSAVPAATGTSGLREQMEEALDILVAVVGVVLVVACANIASLMLGRSITRNREIALRRALGASRARLIRQFLTECLLLATAGALLGLLLAHWGSLLLVRFISTTGNQVFLDLSHNWRTLAFTASVTMVTALLFGLLPALRSTRVSLTAEMKGIQWIDTQRGVRLRSGRWVIASQMALSLVMLMVAGLFLRTFMKLVTLDTGFDRTNVLIMSANARPSSSPTKKRLNAWDEIESRVASLPGIVSVSRSAMTPISGSEWNQFLHPDSPNPPTGEATLTYLNSVSPAYFRTLRIPVLSGRDFNPRDGATAPPVAIINQVAARRFYPNLDPVGRFFRLDEHQGKLGPPIQVVGVVRDSKYESLREETYPCAYFPLSQRPGFGHSFMIRTAGPPPGVLSLIRQSVRDVDSSISLQFKTLARQVDDSLVMERALAVLSCFFGGLALLLATIGLYGAISFVVARRRKEFGIRLALGAKRLSILVLVLRDVFVILVAGLTAGIVTSLLIVQLLENLLFGLASRDAFTLALAVGTLSVVALIAGCIPARRATKVDPIIALRYE